LEARAPRATGSSLYAEQLVKVEKEQELLKQQLALEAQRTTELTEIVQAHDAELDRIFKPDGDYYTIRGYAKLKGLKTLAVKEAAKLGRMATRLSKQLDLTVEKMSDPRYGEVGCYSEIVLSQIFQ